MKKIIILIMTILLTPLAISATEPKKEVIIFSQPCYYCDLMKEYIKPNIIPKYPNIQFKILDIRESKNETLLRKYVRMYKIPGNQVGLPLTFIGNKYLMGWSDENATKMEQYLDEYIKANTKTRKIK